MSAETGRRVLRHEGEAVIACADALGEPFERAVSWVLECRGRVITCGLGKSGHIARKIAGTLSSTGTPSFFLHAAEAVHGDLGMVTADDILVLYSHSGETDELLRLYPSIAAIGARTILVTGRPESSAGRLSGIVLDTGVTSEACSNNLAPTTSTTVMLALSDALAVAVMESRGFGKEDFARFHPRGTLGRRLLLTVADAMRPTAEIAVVSPDSAMLDIIQSMTEAHVGAACVVQDGALMGLISESDLRRTLLGGAEALQTQAHAIMNPHPAQIGPEMLAVEAFEVFQNFPIKIGELPVVSDGTLKGLLILKDLLRIGIV